MYGAEPVEGGWSAFCAPAPATFWFAALLARGDGTGPSRYAVSTLPWVLGMLGTCWLPASPLNCTTYSAPPAR